MSTRQKLLDWFRRGMGKAGAWLMRKAYGERIMSQLVGNWGSTASPGAWSANRIEQVQHYKHWVFRAIQTIATLATKELPTIARVTPAQDRKNYEAHIKAWAKGTGQHPGNRRFLTLAEKSKTLRGKSNQTVQAHEELEHLDDSHGLVSLIKDPNEPDTWLDFLTETIIFLELTGNAYWYMVPKRGEPGLAEMWVMPSHWVYPMGGRGGKIVDHYEVRAWGQSGSARPMRFEADEFIHFKYKSPLSKIDGASPTQAGAEIIDTYEAVQLAQYFQTKNGANVGTVVQLDAGTDIDDAMLKRFESKWLARFQGEHGFDRPAILPPGAQLMRTPGPEELARMGSSAQLRDYIFGMWGLTKSVCGFMEDVNRAAFEAALAQCFYLVVNPRLSLFGQTLTEKLCPLYGEDIRIFWQDMTPADRATELQEWTLLLNKGMYRPNEYRGWMNLEPLPEGEHVVEPMASVPAGMDAFGGGDEPGSGTGGDALERIRAAVDEGSGDSESKRFDFSMNGTH